MSGLDDHLTRHLFIEGRVHGVGFRWLLCAEANRLGLTGWVRNRRDGRVEALLHGKPDAVNTLTEWARHGPPSAQVEALHCNDLTENNESAALTGFESRPSV